MKPVEEPVDPTRHHLYWRIWTKDPELPMAITKYVDYPHYLEFKQRLMDAAPWATLQERWTPWSPVKDGFERFLICAVVPDEAAKPKQETGT